MRRTNNNAKISGIVLEDFKYSHEVLGEKFYKSKVGVQRRSGTTDEIPVIVSERTTDINMKWCGDDVFIIGEFRSHNKGNDGKGKLELFVLADDFYLSDELNGKWKNNVSLEGHICRKPVYRKLLHDREITEFLLKVERSYNRFDYIPCICWGKNARYVDTLDVGTHLSVRGRIQSRDYFKKLSDEYSERRTTYEISISRLEVIYDANGKNQANETE